ncbi:capsular biosynthesis protein [Brevundimonas sp.]|uniref:capsular biosynthesis protein n=1 Tax=Brevundimonas sp. TaxID=1871086 RepID=UPI002FCA6842
MLAPYEPEHTTVAQGQTKALQGRRFLLVTLPFGPFGRHLNKALQALGADTVHRMVFNAGDAVSWGNKGRRRFSGTAADWQRQFPAIAGEYTDVIIFGESGPYNQAVAELAKSIPARLWVLENGYFRPDWITLERNGVNASSQLPRSAEGYGEPVPEMVVSHSVGRILPYHIINISVYHLVQLLGGWLYPNYRNPYTIPAWLQCVSHVQRYLRLAFRPAGQCDTQTLLQKGPFFIGCLQREGDNQLLRYSKYADNTAFIVELMNSFAKHAPVRSRLVLKNHPLDPGLVDFGAVVKNLAVSRGLADRVDFIDGGNLAELCRASEGMVVNNSSAALSALGFGTPVKVLGKAFFNFEGLTCQKSLHEFWKHPKPADPELFKRFRAHVLAKAQINGNFHEPRVIRRTARAIAARLVRLDS